MIILFVCMCLLCSNILSFNLNIIVRFVCEGCIYKPNGCCIGTILSPRYIISTNYCATMCQFIEINNKMYKIKQYHIYPYAKTYTMGYSFIGINTIALVEVDFTENKYITFIKLSSVDIPKLTGSPALIPVLDGNKKFRIAEIKTCNQDSSYLDPNYICAGEKDFEDCFIREGTPLISNDILIGIMGVQDFRSCQYSERIFIAVQPISYWIKYILDSPLHIKRKRELFTSNYRRKFLRKVKTSININSEKPTKTMTRTKQFSVSGKTSKSKINRNSYKTNIVAKKKNAMKQENRKSNVRSKTKNNRGDTKKNIKKSANKKKIVKKRVLAFNKKIPKQNIKRMRKRKDCTRPKSIDNNFAKKIKITKKQNKKSVKKNRSTSRNIQNSKKTYFNIKRTSKRFTSKPKTSHLNLRLQTPTQKNNRIKTTTVPTVKVYDVSLKRTSIKALAVTGVNKKPKNGTTKTTTSTISITEVGQKTKPTNAMDWFKNVLKNMSNKSSTVLILTPAKIQTKFIDLT